MLAFNLLIIPHTRNSDECVFKLTNANMYVRRKNAEYMKTRNSARVTVI